LNIQYIILCFYHLTFHDIGYIDNTSIPNRECLRQTDDPKFFIIRNITYHFIIKIAIILVLINLIYKFDGWVFKGSWKCWVFPQGVG